MRRWSVADPWDWAKKQVNYDYIRELRAVQEKVAYLFNGGATNSNDKYALSSYQGCSPEENLKSR